MSAQRLQRFCKLARLWLLRGAGWLIAVAGLCEPLERAVLNTIAPFTKRMTWVVLTLIVLLAQQHLPAPAKRTNGGPPRRLREHVQRSVFGARLRKLARARDPRALIMKLLSLLDRAEDHAKSFARRFANGLTRRLGGFKRETREASLVRMLFAEPASADTS